MGKQIYPGKTKEEIKKVVDEVFKDYKDPTENMTLGQKIEFDKAMKKIATNLYKNEANKSNINK